MIDYTKAITCILEDEKSVALGDLATVLTEAAEAQEIDSMSYLLKFEEFLDDCGIYTFKGWEDARILKDPDIGKYWVTVDMLLPSGASLEAAAHIAGRDTDAKITHKKTDDGVIVKVKIIRNRLDDIEIRNRKAAEKDAQEIKSAPLSRGQDAMQAPPAV